MDPEGRVTSVSENAGGAGPYTAAYTYTANDLPRAVAYPNGTSMALGYDANNALTALTLAGPNTGAAATTLSTAYAYAYDAAGRITGTTTISGTDTVAHDGAGRLTSDCGQQPIVRNTGDHCYRWTYDKNDNVTSQVNDNGSPEVYTYSATQPNEVVQATALQGNVPAQDQYKNPNTYYAYDGNGDVTAITAPVNGAYTDTAAINTHVAYDAQARPVQVTHLSKAVPITATIGYNADGLRARYTVVMSGTAIDDERFSYRGGELGSVSAVTATLNANGSVKSQGAPYTDTFIYGPEGEPLEFVRQQGGAATRYFYALDGQGNVVAVTRFDGTVVDRYTYDLWGEATGKDYETVPQQLRYAGYWWDGELEWYWLAGRYYDPEDLRFLQPDPTDLDGVHTYVYALDDPADLQEVGGAFGVPHWLRHAVTFIDSAAHVTYKIAAAAWNAVAGDDIHIICCTSEPRWVKALAAVDLATTVVPGLDLGKVAEVGAKVAVKEGAERGVLDLVRFLAKKSGRDLGFTDDELRAAVQGRRAGGAGAVRDAERGIVCRLCFPAGTLVATPGGERAIDALRAGDMVLAEDPQDGTVEAAPVQAVLRDPAKALMAVDLSDGSAITTTADHPVWVDAGTQLAGPGWYAAGRLRPGDELRTAAGAHVMVVGLRRDVGRAVVYTLTVATDHTFFVGSARALVHNCDDLSITPQGNGEYVARVPGDPKFFYRVVRSANGVDVTDTYKGSQPQAGGAILADLLRKVGLSHPSFMRLTNVLNKPTSDALAQGTDAKDTVLGKMVQVAVRDLGGRITKWQVYEDLGKVYIEVAIEY